MSPTATPVVLQAGFRPLFLLAALAAIAVVLRTVLVLHGVGLPAGNPFAWHGHELLFGYVAAAMAGFLLTAVPNWTGTAPVAGAPLLAGVALWLVARVGLWAGPPAWWAIAADVAFLPAIALIAARPLWARGSGRQWLPLVVVGFLALANAFWHAAVLLEQPQLAQRALAFATMLIALQIAVIGGRITPAFTRNHLAARGGSAPPRAPDLRDGLAIGASAAVALAEFIEPLAAGWLALLAAPLHALRLHGWRGTRVWREPLLLVLHAGYAWLAVGYAIRAAALLGPAWAGPWALHGLLVGAIGTMTLAVMARATLGHTGRPLRAGTLLTLAFLALQAAAVSRLLGPWAGADAWRLAGALWIAAFALFLLRCGPMLLAPRADAPPGGVVTRP
ncbi:MAG: NnrS family protein [Halofilum sp. (in: g-proteobacteria)]|nr:NnrS family protein [Halofilum sp. (in: g-proteobacteria)]